MQPHINVTQFPKRTHTDDPRFIAWRWDRGALTISVEDFDDLTDGLTLLTFSPEVGVEIGEPTVLALSGEPSMLRFNGSFEDHRDTIFNQWDKLAKENDRPAIFDEQGLRGLARLAKLPQPPLPEIDEERTAHENEVLRVSRERVAVAGKVRDQTLEDCVKITEQVEAEMASG
jgi:hypothetical protein